MISRIYHFSLLLLLSVQALIAQQDSNVWDALSLDEKFYATAHGYVPSHPMGSLQWGELLAQIVKESTEDNRSSQKQFKSASTRFPAPVDLGVELASKLSALGGAYEEFRLKSPESEWFKSDRLPARIKDVQDVVTASLAVAQQNQCPPSNDQAADIKDLVKKAEEKGAQAQSEKPVTAAAAATANLQDRTAAVSYVRTLALDQLPLDPPISSRSSAMQAPKKNINQWAKGASIKRIIFHHTATGSAATPQDIQAAHFNRGWSDVGYHFLIAPDGTIYEGRSLKHQGANAEGNNHDSIGIAFIGNFESHSASNPSGFRNASSEAPSEAAIQSAVALSTSLMNSQSKLNKQLVTQGVSVGITDIIGHTDCKSTACPGEACLPVIRVVKERLITPPADPKIKTGEKAP